MTFQELYNKYNPILGPNGTRSITGAVVNEFITDLKSVFTLQQEQIETVKTAVTGSQSLGTITTASTIPAEGNVWGFAAPGTYPNAGNLTVAENTLGILTRVGTTWSKVEVAMPQSDPAKLPLYSAIKTADIVSGTQFIDDENGNDIYLVLEGQTLVVGDNPSDFVDVKVKRIGGVEPKIKEVLSDFLNSSGSWRRIPTVPNGYYDENANFTSYAGLGAIRIDFPVNTIKINGAMIGSPASPYVGILGKNGTAWTKILMTEGQNFIDKVFDDLDAYEQIIINIQHGSGNYVEFLDNAEENTVKNYVDSSLSPIAYFQSSETIITDGVLGYYDSSGVFTGNGALKCITVSTLGIEKIDVYGRQIGAPYQSILGKKNNVFTALKDGDGTFINKTLTDFSAYDYIIFQAETASGPTVKTHKSTYNSVKEYIDKNASVFTISNERFLNVERPKFARIDFFGILPIDESNTRLPEYLNFTFSFQNGFSFSSKCKLAIQGHSTALHPKKGYTFDILNALDQSLKIKFGDMVAADSLHLKAFATDRTHTRDIGLGRIWRDMIRKNPYPINKVNNIPFDINPTKENALYIGDAKYHTEGFPIEFYLNGQFHGLYTLRHKKTRENYALDNTNLNHIFLDSYLYNAFLHEGFTAAKWELKSPKMTGYIEGGTIPNATVESKVVRLFDWMRAFYENTSTARADYAQYIVFEAWRDYIIFCEAMWNFDINGNNNNIMTWDGNHWVFIPYDMDCSLGLDAWSGYQITTEKTDFVGNTFWGAFKSHFNAQIKARYTELRKSGFLTTQNLMPYFEIISENIPRNIYMADKTKWSGVFTNGEPTMEQISLFINNRLEWLDTQWLIP